MNDERFAWAPEDAQSIVREHNAKLEEPDFERDRRSSGSFAEAQNRLKQALDSLTELALRSNHES